MVARRVTKKTTKTSKVKKAAKSQKAPKAQKVPKKLPDHVIIPKHTKLSEAEKNSLFETYKISLNNLPKIFSKDPAIATLNLKQGDVVKIQRKSEVAGTTIFYRGVIDE